MIIPEQLFEFYVWNHIYDQGYEVSVWSQILIHSSAIVGSSLSTNRAPGLVFDDSELEQFTVDPSTLALMLP